RTLPSRGRGWPLTPCVHYYHITSQNSERTLLERVETSPRAGFGVPWSNSGSRVRFSMLADGFVGLTDCRSGAHVRAGLGLEFCARFLGRAKVGVQADGGVELAKGLTGLPQNSQHEAEIVMR